MAPHGNRWKCVFLRFTRLGLTLNGKKCNSRISILCFLDSIYQCSLGHNLSQNATNSFIFFIKSAKCATVLNQIYLVTSMCLTVDTSFIFTKKSNVAKWFFVICNAEMAQWLQKSWNLDIQSQFSMSKIVQICLKKCSLKNLGPHFLLSTFIDNFNFKILL